MALITKIFFNEEIMFTLSSLQFFFAIIKHGMFINDVTLKGGRWLCNNKFQAEILETTFVSIHFVLK